MCGGLSDAEADQVLCADMSSSALKCFCFAKCPVFLFILSPCAHLVFRAPSVRSPFFMMDSVPTGVPSRAHQIITTAIACSVLSTIFVASRIYTRSRINWTIGWDDYTALLTLPFCIAFAVILGIATRYGMGLHAWDLPGDLIEQYQKWIFIINCTYLPCLLGYKMSILFLYLRVFNVSPNFRYCTWTVMFITFGYLFSNFWTQIFGCHPIAKYWKPKIPGHCILTIKADYGYGSLNFITDLLIFILPLPMVWRLQMSRKDKFGVSVIFMIGSVSVCPILRHLERAQLIVSLGIGLSPSYVSPTWCESSPQQIVRG